MARTVEAPDGVRWRVGRQWAPWRVNVRRERTDSQGGDSGGGWLDAFGDTDGLLAAFGALALAAVVLFLAWSIVAVLIELAVVLLGVLVAAVGRVALRRPWTVRAAVRGRDRHAYVWRVVGWRASGELVAAVADAVATGGSPPPGAIEVGAPRPLPTAGRGERGPRRGA